jgi:hypothetical protein
LYWKIKQTSSFNNWWYDNDRISTRLLKDGYTTAATQTLIAKLTPLGRQLLVTSNNTLITSFSLGDSDANYNALLPLTTGQIPAESGNY